MIEELKPLPERKMKSAFITEPELAEELIASWKEVAGQYKNSEDIYYYGHKVDERPNFDPRVNEKGNAYAEQRYTLVNRERKGLFKESAKRLQGVDFYDEIESLLNIRQGKNAKLKLLVTGADLAFLNDELRSYFGDKVEVFGTTVELSHSKKRKKRFVRLIKAGKINMPSELQEYLAATLNEEFHPNDTKWRSILQLKKPESEFDAIIDTNGELKYSYDKDKPDIFKKTFVAALAKLNPGGKLYIADLRGGWDFVESQCAEYGYNLEKIPNKEINLEKGSSYIITRPS